MLETLVSEQVTISVWRLSRASPQRAGLAGLFGLGGSCPADRDLFFQDSNVVVAGAGAPAHAPICGSTTLRGPSFPVRRPWAALLSTRSAGAGWQSRKAAPRQLGSGSRSRGSVPDRRRGAKTCRGGHTPSEST